DLVGNLDLKLFDELSDVDVAESDGGVEIGLIGSRRIGLGLKGNQGQEQLRRHGALAHAAGGLFLRRRLRRRRSSVGEFEFLAVAAELHGNVESTSLESRNVDGATAAAVSLEFAVGVRDEPD